MGFQNKVYQIVKKIPKGKVATYKQIAKAIGSPKAHRAVGNVLNRNKDKKVPCHRVIKFSGEVGGFRWGTAAKIKRLRKEKIIIVNRRVNLERYSINF